MPERKRQANGSGSVYQRASDGRFCAQVTLPSGRTRTRYAKTRVEAAKLLRQLQREVDDGTYTANTRLTVEQFLIDWLRDIKPTIRFTTWTKYEMQCRCHIIPKLGRLKLHQLEARHVQALYSALDGQLGPRTIRFVHATLRCALGKAVKWGTLTRNVATLADTPRLERREFVTLDQAGARRLLETARGDRLEALWVLALSTGMRQGELLALRWRDVDLDGGRLGITGTLTRDAQNQLHVTEPKTAQSRRTVLLTQVAVRALRRHRTDQTVSRLMAGPAWHDLDYVFATGLGTAFSPSDIRLVHFYPLLERAGLPKMRFHDLRHSAATLLLERGIPPTVVAEQLGHSTAMLLSVYAHVTQRAQERAVSAMDDILKEAK